METDAAEPANNHKVLLLILPYLPLQDLLVTCRVCSYLRDAVKNEVMLWSNLVVNEPLAYRLSDQTLVEVASRANGKLTTLVLINCFRISDSGLQRVVGANSFIRKLWLPGCTGLTPGGVIEAVKLLPKLETLQVNGICSFTRGHLSELIAYLPEESSQRCFFYHQRRWDPLTFPETSIDVEVCPRCGEVRMVHGCSRMACQSKLSKGIRLEKEYCRACAICVPRCEECGGCILQDEEAEESVCGDVLCLDCWLKLPKCNLCNKPYCRFHARILHGSCGVLEREGFVCEICQ